MHNLILISLDTVRADSFVLPEFQFFKSLMAKGVYFTNAFSHAPLTPVSHASILTGVMPERHGIRHLYKECLNQEIDPLAKILKLRGYSTGAFVSCAGMDHWYGFSRGFDIYDDDIPRLPDGRRPVETASMDLRGRFYRTGEKTVSNALQWVERLPEEVPFFCFLHLFDAHLPYEPPEPFAADLKNPYLGCIGFLESLLEQFFASPRIQTSLDNTIIVILSDHGEDLGEHGKPNGRCLHEEGHGSLLTEVTLHVPLLFIGPGIPQSRICSQQVGLVDVCPTVLNALGIKSAYPLDGRSLAGFFNGEELKSTSTIWLETHFPSELAPPVGPLPPLFGLRIQNNSTCIKVVWTNSGVPVAAFNLKEDPDERENLLTSGPKALQDRAMCSLGIVEGGLA